MSGAFAGRSPGQLFPVVSAVAKLTGEDGKAYAAFVHEALLDSNPAQVESLLSVHQSLRLPNNGIDDRARCERDVHGNPGAQCSKFGDHILPFYFDGTKCFYEVHSISEEELRVLPRVTLTDGSVPYDPTDRLHSRRRTSVTSERLLPWKQCLGFVPDHVVTRTLDATSQLVPSVEAESREMMRDHFHTRIPELKVRRVNDTCYVDTFFSSIPSVRGYTCWNLYSFRRTGLDVVYLMRRRAQTPSTLPRMVTDCGAPVRVKSDNAPEFKGKKWTSYLESMSILSEFTEAHHPNENLAERRGGAIKAATVHLLRVTGCPLEFWCYALEHVSLLRTVTARRSLNWSTPHELHWGERPDISMFRFVFWEPVWYYNPRQAFPRTKMLKGRFLGIAQNIGDAFCFLILTQPESEDDGSPQVLARSVVRRRYSGEGSPVVTSSRSTTTPLVIYKSDGVTPLDDWIPNSGDDDQTADIVDLSVNIQHSEASGIGGLPSSDGYQRGLTEEDAFESGLVEVYGPLTKRPRPEHMFLPPNSSDSRTVVPQHDDDGDLEELPTNNSSSDLLLPSSPEQLQDSPNTMCVVPGSAIAMGSLPEFAATSNADSQNDGSASSPQLDSAAGDVFHPITQDYQDVEPETLDEITHQLTRIAEDSSEDELFDSISGHEWDEGILKLLLKWKTGETSALPFSVCKRDYPRETAEYVLHHKLGSANGRYSSGRYTRWARQYSRHFSRILRRLIRSSSIGLLPGDRGIQTSEHLLHVATNLPDGTRLIRRVVSKVAKAGGKRKQRKPGRISRPVQEKYGVIVPRSVAHALQLDAEAGNTLWADAIKKEIESLLALHCFEFHSPDYKPSSDFQWTKLSMIFEVKQDGRRKARLVAGGHMVDPMGVNSRSTVVKGISVRLLDIIAHRDNLPILCGDIGNAFITADCMEKIYTYAGPEFGEREGSLLIFKKALYGLRSSSRAFRTHFADFLRSLGFSATRYDRDVWMRPREEADGYDYICTHVDDFKIVARDPERWKAHISGVFLLKSIGPPAYYLGNDYNFSETENAWVVSCATYLKECVRRLESDPDLNGGLWPKRTPLPEGCHPELDESTLLSELGIRKYQMLIGMAQWAVTIGRLDITFAVSSLSRFSAAPREHHLELAYHLFGYLKKYPNRRIVVDSRPLLVDDALRSESFHPDFLEDYPDAKEDLADDFPTPFGRELETAVFFDADHAHDHVTRRSISGLLVFVGSTPVLWQSKRQGCIATSTYCAEFISMRSAVEEAISIRYMLRCLGVPVTHPTDLYGDNFGVIQSAEIPEGELKKKHIAISYHYVREAIAAQIVNAHWCKSSENFADVCTKALGSNIFHDLVSEMMA